MEQKIKISDEVWIVIPAFNEETSIGILLDQLKDKEYSIVVVDDCSTDNTSTVALNYPVILLKHLINLGQGAALQTGFDYIINNTSAKYVITFDSDGQHAIEDIKNLLQTIAKSEFDVVLGSRFLDRNSVKNIPFLKFITLKMAVIFTRISTGLKITDTHNGLRAFTIEALRQIQIIQNKMAHASEILSQVSSKNLSWKEIPVNIYYTDYSKKKGQSVFNALNILWELFFEKD